MVRTFGNVIWHFPGLGFMAATQAFVFGLILIMTVILAPAGRGLWEVGKFYLSPFSRAIVNNSDLIVKKDALGKVWSIIAMILYIPLGLIMSLSSLVSVAILLVPPFTVVGVAGAMVCANALRAVFNPVDKKCVPRAVGDELARRRAKAEVAKYLGESDQRDP